MESLSMSTDVKDIESSLEGATINPNLKTCVEIKGDIKIKVTENKDPEEDDNLKTQNVFEWAPFEFPVPKVQSVPYTGPGTFGQVRLQGKFMPEFYKGQRRQRVELFDTLGMVIGRIDLEQAMIVEVEEGDCVDSEGFVKIFPIGANICTYYTNPDCRVIIYAVKYKKSIDGSGKLTKNYEYCRYTTMAAVKQEVQYTRLDPFESFSRKRRDDSHQGFKQKANSEKSTESLANPKNESLSECGQKAAEVFAALARYWEAYSKCEHRASNLQDEKHCSCHLYRKRYQKTLHGKPFMPPLIMDREYPNDTLEDYREAWKACKRCQSAEETKSALPL